MSVNAVATFLSIGALLLLACVIAVWVVRVLAIASPRARRIYDTVVVSLEGQGLKLAWTMAIVAMAGSLYFSEIAGFIPCELCWYQRIAMYPLVAIFGLAILARDHVGVRRYALGLAIPGALIAAYHYLIEWFPNLEVGQCSTVVGCSTVWFRKFEIVSIPFMAFVCFSVIITVLAIDRPRAVDGAPADADDSLPSVDPQEVP